MSDKKIIAVIGATGAQGGGLMRAILGDAAGGFAARGITRKTDSEKARALTEQGATMVAADLDDPPSLRRAFEGAHAAFCLTNFWEHFSPEKELAQAKALAEAARDARVKHVIWSTLEDTRQLVPVDDDRMPTLMGKYKVPHFDAKGEADEIFRQVDVPTTNLRTSFYWDNFIHFGMGPQAGPDGKLAITLPIADKKLPGIAVEDIGRCAYGVIKAGGKYIGQTIGIAGEMPTGSEMAAAMSKALGKSIAYNAVPYDVYRSFGFDGVDDITNMFQYKVDFNDAFCAARSVELSRQLNPALQSLADWMAKDGAKIPLPA